MFYRKITYSASCIYLFTLDFAVGHKMIHKHLIALFSLYLCVLFHDDKENRMGFRPLCVSGNAKI